MSSATSLDTVMLARWNRRLLWLGGGALLVCAVGGLFDPGAFGRAYLTAYLFFLGLGLGSLAMLMIYHLTGGSWGLLIRRILEAGTRTLPLLALFFLPIAGSVRYLYPWAQPELVALSPKLQYQQFYLAPLYFWLRAAVYFALWIGLAWALSVWSRQEDRTGNPRLAWKSLQLSALGAVVYGVTIHFAAVDWAMSLQPVFHSTIWGPLIALGQLLSAFAWALVVLAGVIRRPPLAEVASRKAVNDLGSVLLALLILWAYMAWFQFMLVWIANLPVDVVWYLPRTSWFWKGVIGTLVALHFVLPFFLLLLRPIKRNSTALAWIAGVMLLMQLVHLNYLVVPRLAAGRVGVSWMDFVAPLAIGGLWLPHYFWQLRRRPLLAPYDYNRADALHLRQLDAEEDAQADRLAYE